MFIIKIWYLWYIQYVLYNSYTIFYTKFIYIYRIFFYKRLPSNKRHTSKCGTY